MSEGKKSRSLLSYLALRLIVPLLVPLLGLLIGGVIVYQQLVASLVLERDSELGDLAELDLRIELREYSEALHDVAVVNGLDSTAAATRQAALEDVAVRLKQLYAAVALLDDDGAVLNHVPGAAPGCFPAAAEQTDYHTAPSPMDSLISNVIIDPGSGETMVALGVRLAQSGAGPAAVLLGCVPMRYSDMMEVIASLTVYGSGYAYLVDRNGRAIYHPEAAELGADFSDRSYVQEVRAGLAGGILWDSPEGDRWFVDYTPIPEAGWGVIVKEPREVAVAAARIYGWLLVGLGVVIIFIVFFLLWSVARRVVTPIGVLARQTAQLAAGEEVESIQRSGVAEIDALGQSFEHMAKQIVAYRSSLRRYIGLITQSQEDERQRIARELHDDTVQQLIGVVRRIELMQASAEQPTIQAQLSTLRSHVVDCVQGVRQISRDLRPPMLDELGLVKALHTLTATTNDETNGAGSPREWVALTVEGEPAAPLDPELELTLYRIAQESLSNVRRHAQATRAIMRLSFRNGFAHLLVSDNGRGFQIPNSFSELVQQGSLGLMGIQERVWAAGGKLDLESKPGAGTSIHVAVPVKQVA